MSIPSVFANMSHVPASMPAEQQKNELCRQKEVCEQYLAVLQKNPEPNQELIARVVQKLENTERQLHHLMPNKE
jgi:hypothetical protein